MKTWWYLEVHVQSVSGRRDWRVYQSVKDYGDAMALLAAFDALSRKQGMPDRWRLRSFLMGGNG